MSSSEINSNRDGKNQRGIIGSFLRWFRRNRRIQLIFIVLVISIPAFMVVYGIVFPTRNYKPSIMPGITSEIHDNGSVSLSDEQLSEVHKIILKENEIAYQKGRYSLSEKDSVYFILNIPDSAIILEIKGVPVRVNKILKMEISNRFALINHENLLPWLSEPFVLRNSLSTIPKSPIVIKQAPKDTIEAAKQSSGPTPPDSTDVYFTLYFDRNLVLEVEQDNPLGKGNAEKVKEYKATKRKESNRSVFETFRNPQQANQPLRIKLVMRDEDAKAIYRALPANSHLILRL